MSEHPFKKGDRVVHKDGTPGVVRDTETTDRLTVKHWVWVEFPPCRGIALYDARTFTKHDSGV